MRIAIFSDNFYPEIGGIQDSIEALAKALVDRGHCVDFYVPRYGDGDFERIKAVPVELDLGHDVYIHRLRSLPFPTSTMQSRLVVPSPFGKLSFLRRRRPDVIHTQTFFGVGLRGLMAGRMLGIPVLGTNHTAIRSFGSYIPFNCVDQAAAYVRWYYRKCDLVTAPSRSVFAELCDHGPSPTVHVLSNPIAIDAFRPISQETKYTLRADLRLHGPTIVYAGRLGREKNIDAIFRALAVVRTCIPSTELAIAGHGSEESNLRDLARHLGIESGVRFLGTLSKSHLAKLFQASDVFVTMSTSETQCMALLQAMACGLPVIAADARALPEYVGSDRGFLVEPADIATLGQRLTALLTDPGLRWRLGEAGASYATQFSTDRIADRWETLYELAIEGKVKTRETPRQDQLRRAGL